MITCFFLAGNLFLSDGVTAVNINNSAYLELSKGELFYKTGVRTDATLRTEETNLKRLLLDCEQQAEKEIEEKLSRE